jgi:hypothetical protein
MRDLVSVATFTAVAAICMAATTPFVLSLYALHHSASRACSLYLVGSGQERGRSESSTPSDNLFSMPAYREFTRRNTTFSELAASRSFSSAIEVDVPGRAFACPCKGLAAAVTGNYFEILGTVAQHGHLLSSEDDNEVGEPPVVISDRYWKTVFHGDPNILGGLLLLSEHRFRVAGILSDTFVPESGAPLTDLWVPLSNEADVFTEPSDILHRTNTYWLLIVGRLQPDLSLPVATTIVSRQLKDILAQESVPSLRGRIEALDFKVTPISTTSTALTSGVQRFQFLCLTVVLTGLVLLATTGMILSFVDRPNDNIAPNRLTVACGYLPPGVTYVTVGGVVGAVAYLTSGAAIITKWWQTVASSEPPRLLPHVGAIVVSCLIVALVTWTALVSSAMSPRTRSVKSRAALVVPGLTILVILHICISATWCYGAGLLAVKLRHLKEPVLGFDAPQNLLQATLVPRQGATYALRNARDEESMQRLSRLSAVRLASFSSAPLFGRGPRRLATVHVQGRSPFSEIDDEAEVQFVTPSYFSTVGLRLLAGGLFPQDVRTASPSLAVVNDAFVKRYFGDQIPFGIPIRLGTLNKDVTIIGEVAPVASGSLSPSETPTVYLPTTEHDPLLSELQVRVWDGDSIRRDRLHTEISSALPHEMVGEITSLADEQRQEAAPQSMCLRLAVVGGVLANLCLIVVLGIAITLRRLRSDVPTKDVGNYMWKGAALLCCIGAIGAGVSLGGETVRPLVSATDIGGSLILIIAITAGQCLIIGATIYLMHVRRSPSILTKSYTSMLSGWAR